MAYCACYDNSLLPSIYKFSVYTMYKIHNTDKVSFTKYFRVKNIVYWQEVDLIFFLQNI